MYMMFGADIHIVLHSELYHIKSNFIVIRRSYMIRELHLDYIESNEIISIA